MVYIIEIILFQAMFLGLYYLLKKETFFNYNRAYLLITSLLSYVLPFVKLESFKTDIVTIDTVYMLPTVFLNNTTETVVNNTDTSFFVWHWWYIPLSGSLLMLFVFIMKLYKVSLLIKKNHVINKKLYKLVLIKNNNGAFSFFNWIFIGDQINEDDKKVVLAHELIHVKEKHSFDLLFFEMQRVICWFNPLVYQYQREIKSLHEFIVDKKMIEKTGSETYCKNMLSQLFKAPELSLVNTFYKKSIIKKRIAMITKKESKSTARLKYAFIIPVMMGMLFYTSCKSKKTIVQNDSLNNSDTVVDTLFVSYSTQDEKIKKINKLMDLARERDHTGSYVVVNKETSEIVMRGIMEKNKIKMSIKNTEDVPFAAIQNPAVFPGCEETEDLKKCFSNNVNKFIAKNFNIKLPEELGLKGVQRMSAMFKIDTDGNITGINVRSESEELKQEFISVLERLPQMEPATHNGEKVNMLFSLPLVFRVGPRTEEKK